MRLTHLLAIALTLGATFSLQADVLIDDFSEADFFRQGSAFSSFHESQALSGPAPIALRLCNVVPLAPDPGSIELEVTGDTLRFSTQAVTTGVLLNLGWFGGLQPGAPPSGSGILLSSDLLPLSPSLDLSAETAFVLDYVNSSRGAVSYQIFVYNPSLDDLTIDQSEVASLPVGSGRLIVHFSEVFSNVASDSIGGLGISLIYGGGVNDVQLHRFAATRPVFDDGFESGDTAQWSSTLP